MGMFVMDDSFIAFLQDSFNELRRLPLLNDHYDKLIVILGVVLLLYFVGSLVRNVLLGALVVFLLWGFRYQDMGDSRHVNRYTGAVCDVTRECWQSGKTSDFYDRRSEGRSDDRSYGRSYDRSYDRSSYR
jgi:hypothetical protein